MIYTDYMRRKMHNVVKLDTKEGYPLTVYNCANKNLKDYTIYGNTVYGENLFNYTEPYNDKQIIADEDGWFDVTIDNTEGTSTTFKWCFTAVNNALKPNTEYILFTEIAECTGSITVQALSQYSDSKSQFTNTPVRYNTAGTRTVTLTTLSSFDDCKTMLRSHCYCGAGRSGHAKFRIAVYETQKDVFLPYSKNSVGDKTENVFNYTEPYDDTQITADENGWFDVTIDNSSGGNDKEAHCFTKVNLDLKPNTNYYLVLEVAERTGNINIRPNNDNNRTSQFNTATRVDSPDVGIKPPQKIVSKSTFINESIKYMLHTYAFCTPGKSGHIKFRIAVYETEKNYFEPYDKHKIPILVNGENNAVIYLNAPLADGESINYKTDNLPDIVLNKGTNTITTDTAVKPKKIIAKYYKK